MALFLPKSVAFSMNEQGITLFPSWIHLNEHRGIPPFKAWDSPRVL